MGLGNGDWISGRMERNGELRYMMNGHYDIDFLLSSSLSNRDTPVSYHSTTTERTNKRATDGRLYMFRRSSSSFPFFFLLRDEWDCQTCVANHGMQGGGLLDITFPFDFYVESTKRADG